MRAEIRDALRDYNGRIMEVDRGEEALRLLVRVHPRVLVVDVALAGRAPFELCDDIAQAGLRTRVLLVASVYHHTRYKRRPTSLYGADDYVEQHHIPDMLPDKVARLLGEAPGPWQPRAVDPVLTRRVLEAGQALLTIHYETPEEGALRAARLCELIVADMTLYSGDVLSGLAPGAPLPEELASDLDAARALFRERVPEKIRGERDWIGEAFSRWLDRQAAGRRRRGQAGGAS